MTQPPGHGSGDDQGGARPPGESAWPPPHQQYGSPPPEPDPNSTHALPGYPAYGPPQSAPQDQTYAYPSPGAYPYGDPAYGQFGAGPTGPPPPPPGPPYGPGGASYGYGAPPPQRSKAPLFIIAAVVLIGLIGGGVWFFGFRDDGDGDSNDNSATQSSSNASSAREAAESMVNAVKNEDREAIEQLLCDRDREEGLTILTGLTDLGFLGELESFELSDGEGDRQGDTTIFEAEATVTVPGSGSNSEDLTLPLPIPVIEEDGEFKICGTGLDNLPDLPSNFPTDLPTDFPDNLPSIAPRNVPN